MKFLRYILIFTPLLLAMSCREAQTLFGYDTVAKVGRKTLTAADIAQAVPKGITGQDSVNYVDSYMDKWIIRQLKLQEAELIFSTSEGDIDRMVEEYRQSLLIRKIEQYYLDKDVDFEITDDDIEQYYNSHKSDFRLSAPVVRGYVVTVPERYRRREWLLKQFSTAKSMDSDKFKDAEQVCLKSNFKLVKYEQWVDYTEFLANLPLLRTDSNDKLLAKRDIQQIRHNSSYYCFRVTDVLKAGEPMPLFMAKDKIVRILINRRHGEIIRQNEERIRTNADNNGLVKVYRDIAIEIN